MAAKKKSGRGGPQKPEDKKLTYKRLPANLGKTDYDDLIEFEKETGFLQSQAIRQLIRDGIKLWKSKRNPPDSSTQS